MIVKRVLRTDFFACRTLVGLVLLALFVGSTAQGTPRQRRPPKAQKPVEGQRPAQATGPDATGPDATGQEEKGPEEQKGPEYHEALKHFRQGIADFDGGYYREAIDKFQAAMKLYPSPKIHTRIALCHVWLGNFLKALEHYELFLKEFTTEPDNEADRRLRRDVETKEVPKLLKMIAHVKIVMEAPPGAEIRINGHPVGVAPVSRVFRLEAGPIAVSATHGGHHEFRRDLNVGRGESAEVAIILLRIKPKVVKVTVRATPVYKRWWFWTVIGAVVAGGTAGLSAYLSLREVPRDLTGTAVNHDGLTLRW